LAAEIKSINWMPQTNTNNNFKEQKGKIEDILMQKITKTDNCCKQQITVRMKLVFTVQKILLSLL